MPSEYGLELEFRLSAFPRFMRFHYRLTNETGREWGVFSRVPSSQLDGSPSYSHTAVYVDIEGSMLHLRKCVLPVPPGLQVAIRVVPGITILHDGDRFIEALELPLPIPADNPYRQALLVGASHGANVQASKACLVSSAMLSIGLFPLAANEKLLPLSQSFPDVFRVWPPDRAVSSQVVLTASLSFDLPVPALDYEVAGS